MFPGLLRHLRKSVDRIIRSNHLGISRDKAGNNTILENGIDLDPSDEPAFDRLTETYTGRGRFCRDTTKLLTH